MAALARPETPEARSAARAAPATRVAPVTAPADRPKAGTALPSAPGPNPAVAAVVRVAGREVRLRRGSRCSRLAPRSPAYAAGVADSRNGRLSGSRAPLVR